MALGQSLDFFIAAIAVALFHVFFALLALDKLPLKKLPIYSVLGGITYPLYLIHNRAGKALIEKISSFMTESIAIVLTTILMLILAYFIYRFIEPTGSIWLKTALTKTSNRYISPAKSKISIKKTSKGD
jgi:peptidoglycan/LPS O-acetylase OafA/YrhL